MAEPVALLPPPGATTSQPRSHATGHVYPLLMIQLALTWVCLAHTSFRATALLLGFWPGWPAGPGAETVRTWLLRVGLFLLQRPLEQRSDWVFLIDATIPLGPFKCLLILGVPLAHYRDGGHVLGHHQVTVVTRRLVSHWSGEVSAHHREPASQRTGVPRQVVSDPGSDLRRGVRLFQAEHPEVVATYDISHGLGGWLQKEWEPETRWHEFVACCQRTAQQRQQTAGSFLRPPAGRQQSRYRNLEGQLRWAAEMLAVLESGGGEARAGHLPLRESAARVWREDKLGWLRGFAAEVASWGYLQAVVIVIETEITTNGLSRHSAAAVRRQLRPLRCPDERGRRFTAGVLELVRGAGEVGPEGETYVGSTDVVESLFGKYKEMAKRAPSRELGALVLSLPVLVSELSVADLKGALESVSGEDVAAWLDQERGPSPRQKKHAVLAEAGGEDELQGTTQKRHEPGGGNSR